MDHLIEQCSGIANPTRLNRKFHIVVIYETFVSAVRALRACELLRQEIPPDIRMCISAWRIESLHDPAERQLSASHAARADLVIVSTPGHNSMPQILHDWSDLWLEQGVDSPSALLALFGDHISTTATAAALSLQKKTEPHGIDFFIHPPATRDSGFPQHSLGWQNNHLPRPLHDSSTTHRIVPSESVFDTIEHFGALVGVQFIDRNIHSPVGING